jgi:hypothetical protein
MQLPFKTMTMAMTMMIIITTTTMMFRDDSKEMH